MQNRFAKYLAQPIGAMPMPMPMPAQAAPGPFGAGLPPFVQRPPMLPAYGQAERAAPPLRVGNLLPYEPVSAALSAGARAVAPYMADIGRRAALALAEAPRLGASGRLGGSAFRRELQQLADDEADPVSATEGLHVEVTAVGPYPGETQEQYRERMRLLQAKRDAQEEAEREARYVIDGDLPWNQPDGALRVNVTAFGPRLPGETQEEYDARTERLQAEKDAEEAAELRRRQAERDTLLGEIDAGIRGVADTVTFGLADRGAAALDTLFYGGTFDENFARQKEITAADEAVNPYMRLGGQLAGGFALPTFGLRTAPQIGALGAGYGGAYGLGKSGGDPVEGAKGALWGGLAGYGMTKAMPYVEAGVGTIVNRFSTDRARENLLADTAERLGIHPMPATVGGRTAEMVQAGLGVLPGSRGVIRNAADREVAGLAQAARGTAGRFGPVRTPEGAGRAVVRGARAFERATGRRAQRMFEQRNQLMGGGGSPVMAYDSARKFLGLLQEFPASPVLRQMLENPTVQRLRGYMPDDAWTLDEATEALSHISGALRAAQRDGTLTPDLVKTGSDLQTWLQDEIAAAARTWDGVRGRNPRQGAVEANAAVNRFEYERAALLDANFTPAMRSAADPAAVPPQQVYRQLFDDMRAENGDLFRLQSSMKRLPVNARRSFAATAFDDLGRARPGARNAEPGAWSADTFLANWDSIAPEAKQLVFGGGGAAREIDDILLYADRLRALDGSRHAWGAMGRYADASYLTAIGGALTGLGPEAAAGVAAIYPALSLTARGFLATPVLRRWLRTTLAYGAEGDRGRVAAMIGALPGIAARNPAVAQEVGAMQGLLRFVNESLNGVVPIAASNEENEKD